MPIQHLDYLTYSGQAQANPAPAETQSEVAERGNEEAATEDAESETPVTLTADEDNFVPAAIEEEETVEA